MRIDKFVLDCNIWISYLITKRHEKLAEMINENELIVYSCDELLNEITKVLMYPHLTKYNISPIFAAAYIKDVTLHQELIHPIKRYLPNDENDDYLIALALQTSSGFITSGDTDILSEKENLEKKYKKLKILTKKEFEEMFVLGD